MLDLGGADAHRTLWASVPSLDSVTVLDGVADTRLGDLAAAGERFDTVVSVFQLAGSPHLDVTLGHVRSLLAEAGHVLFLEPARLVGVAGRVQRAVGPPIGALTGWRPDRDVPMALRDSGLSVTSIRRHRVPTLQWWLRQVVEGRAHHRLEPGGAPPARAADAG